MVPFLIPTYIWLNIAVPVTLTASVFFMTESTPIRLTWLMLSPVTFLLSYLVTAGLLSRTGLHAIKPGKFDRSLKDPVYGPRRLYATAWTMIYYCTPFYFIYLLIPQLKHLMLRLFGYKGNTDFTMYPDTWVRDIACLDIGKGAYLSNKSSIATNMCLMSNKILVDGIQVGQKSCVGHGALIGPGTRIGNNTELTTNVTSGVRVHFGDNVLIGEITAIQHGASIGNNTHIGMYCAIGLRAKIGDNIKIPEGSHIQPGVRIRTQEEANQYYSEETAALTASRGRAVRTALDASKGFQAQFSNLGPYNDQDSAASSTEIKLKAVGADEALNKSDDLETSS
jgi:carbonic anhydrase/acetyltransferase-like protein (isoleucine patch superfamily)